MLARPVVNSMPGGSGPQMAKAPPNPELQAVLRTLVLRLKRGPEELLTPLSNGAGLSPQSAVMTVDHDAKKAKLDQGGHGAGAVVLNSPGSAGRSRVVHLRNVPSDMTDVELIHLCIPFGKVTNFLLLKGKNQAFVEYEDEGAAMSLVGVSNSCPMALRGRTIFCQFSNHQELKTDNRNAFNVVASSSQPMGAMVPVVDGGEPTVVATQQQPNSVLRVIIENMLYPVTLDILYQIFSRFGKVLRIITFSKNNTFQALIQLSEAQAAQLAKTALDSQNVYNGCCTLRIDYSKLATLNVKYNNDKSRDYTNPNLPSGEIPLEHPLGLMNAAAAGMLAAGPQHAAGLALQNPLAAAGFHFPAAATATYAAALPQAAALQASAANPMQLNLPAFSLANAAASLQNTSPTFGGMAGLRAAVPGLSLQQQIAALAFSPVILVSNLNEEGMAGLRAGVPGLSLQQQIAALAFSPVILVSNLNEEKVTPDALFTLFGVYGDVQRVKVLFNKKDNALIQYAEPAQAQLAIQHLDKVKLWGKQMRVAASKHMNVQMPKEGQPDAGLTKDYSQSPLHRFKKPGSKNYMNIYSPSPTLHLSNIPPSVTEEFLLEAFTQSGFAVKNFKFFPKDHKMALIQLGSVEEALQALIQMHNFKLAENAHLRVSFSKSGI